MNIKKQQLIIDPGTAMHRIKKDLLFKYVKRAKDNFCFRCGKEIEEARQLSIDHKEPWLHSKDPIKLFFNLENVTFSHLSCNIVAARRKKAKCGTISNYQNGCRCELCRLAKKDYRNKCQLGGVA